MIDLSTERSLTLDEATKPAKVSFTTLWRWVVRGIPTRDGGRVRLRAMKLGRRWVTSYEALEEFAAALTPRLDDEPAAVLHTRPPTKRRRASEKAGAELERLGI
jgi:hypothetical protein